MAYAACEKFSAGARWVFTESGMQEAAPVLTAREADDRVFALQLLAGFSELASDGAKTTGDAQMGTGVILTGATLVFVRAALDFALVAVGLGLPFFVLGWLG